MIEAVSSLFQPAFMPIEKITASSGYENAIAQKLIEKSVLQSVEQSLRDG
jgi:hypothetical protein